MACSLLSFNLYVQSRALMMHAAEERTPDYRHIRHELPESLFSFFVAIQLGRYGSLKTGLPLPLTAGLLPEERATVNPRVSFQISQLCHGIAPSSTSQVPHKEGTPLMVRLGRSFSYYDLDSYIETECMLPLTPFAPSLCSAVVDCGKMVFRLLLVLTRTVRSY
jgi:hypothetical protein